ncbi:phage portal protein [Comamonas thiooxydans]|uniref:phage portal protein n=1 Tax=Comamonas thiooxydans TaxID=363952 RepID=UPI00209C2A04|nr:phage portal protein [Comamonas thiooxydans]MCO8250185.1 phage portal protein [Comamonas thiooxydans]
MTNIIDSLVSYVAPEAALRRAQARKVLSHYEAAQPSRLRKNRNTNPSPNLLVGRSASALRNHARYLERNHDITRGVLRTLVNNVVGPNGIGIEPQPRRRDGTIHKEYADQLRQLHRQWSKAPEVTGRMHWAQAERMAAYTWLRDGELFAQQVVGNAPGLVHGSKVPFSLELLEPDFVPLDFTDLSRKIRQGIQVNDWGRPMAYHVFKRDPRESGAWITPADLKSIPAANMLHVSTMDRLHQWRGISELASVLNRVEDLKDYEESERIAAKIAASMAAYVKRLPGVEGFDPDKDSREKDADGNPLPRDLRLQPGMIFDDLMVGEEVGLIDTNRPNPNLVAWRSGQLKAYAAGVGASYSSISRDYGGTYSSLRQELVEQWVHYAVLADDFAGQFSLPVWEMFVRVAHLSGALPIPADVEPGSEDDCLLIGQSMPWIDPLKEANAWEKLVQAGFASEVEVIRRRGGNPREVQDQLQQYREEAAERGLQMSSNPATASMLDRKPNQDEPVLRSSLEFED